MVDAQGLWNDYNMVLFLKGNTSKQCLSLM